MSSEPPHPAKAEDQDSGALQCGGQFFQGQLDGTLCGGESRSGETDTYKNAGNP